MGAFNPLSLGRLNVGLDAVSTAVYEKLAAEREIDPNASKSRDFPFFIPLKVTSGYVGIYRPSVPADYAS